MKSEQSAQTPSTGDMNVVDKSLEGSRIIARSFGPFEVHIRVTADEKFVEIVEISMSEDFRSNQQKIASRGSHDLTDLYKE